MNPLDLADTSNADFASRLQASPWKAEAPTFAQGFETAWRAARDYQVTTAHQTVLQDVAGQSLDGFQKLSGQTIQFPESPRTAEGDPRYMNRYGNARYAVDQWNAAHPDQPFSFPTNDQLQQSVVQRSRASLQAAASEKDAEGEGYSPATLGRWLGGLAGSGSDPLNAAGMVFGAGAAPSLAKALLYDGLIGAGTSVATDASTFGFKREVDPEFGVGDIAADAGEAAAGGVILGGATRGIFAGVKGVAAGTRLILDRYGAAKAAKTPMPRAMLDAGAVLERDAVSASGNPFDGLDGEKAHGAALEAVSGQIDRGEPVELPQAVQDHVNAPSLGDFSPGRRVTIGNAADEALAGQPATIVGPSPDFPGTFVVRTADGSEAGLPPRLLNLEAPAPDPAAAAPTREPGEPAASAPAARDETASQLKARLSDADGSWNATKAGDQIAQEVKASLDRGEKVTLFYDGKPVPVTAVEGGRIKDSQGATLGTMPLVMPQRRFMDQPVIRMEPGEVPAARADAAPGPEGKELVPAPASQEGQASPHAGSAAPDAPVEPRTADAPPAPSLPTARGANRPVPLLDFIASRGGIKPDRIAKQHDLPAFFVPGKGRTIANRGKGLTLDAMREAAVEAGYPIGEHAPEDRMGSSTIADFLGAIDQDNRARQGVGDRVFSDADADTMGRMQEARETDAANARYTEELDTFKREAADQGHDVSNDALMRRAHDRYREGGDLEHADAIERAAIETEGEDPAALAAHDTNPLPGWDDHATDSDGTPAGGDTATPARGQDQAAGPGGGREVGELREAPGEPGGRGGAAAGADAVADTGAVRNRLSEATRPEAVAARSTDADTEAAVTHTLDHMLRDEPDIMVWTEEPDGAGGVNQRQRPLREVLAEVDRDATEARDLRACLIDAGG